MISLTDRPDMALDVYRGPKTTQQQQHKNQPGAAVVLRIIRCTTNAAVARFSGLLDWTVNSHSVISFNF